MFEDEQENEQAFFSRFVTKKKIYCSTRSDIILGNFPFTPHKSKSRIVYDKVEGKNVVLKNVLFSPEPQ